MRRNTDLTALLSIWDILCVLLGELLSILVWWKESEMLRKRLVKVTFSETTTHFSSPKRPKRQWFHRFHFVGFLLIFYPENVEIMSLILELAIKKKEIQNESLSALFEEQISWEKK